LRHTCQWVSRPGSVTARYSSSGRQPNIAALNRGRHLYSVGRPLRLALTHISSLLGDHVQNGSPYAIRPLSVCPVCITLVYCGQTVGRIKMKLGMQVGLGRVHIVLDGDHAPCFPKGGTALPQFSAYKFSAHIYCGQTPGWIKMALGTEAGLSTGDFVLDWGLSLSPKRERSPLPNFRPISIVAKRLDTSRCHLVWR